MVNIVTKSGSNKLHGSAFYYLRNSEFDARDPELTFKPAGQQHQFGFTFGGPLRRNRIFFFAGYDQHIFHEPTVVRFVNGASSVIPQLGAGPATPGDYEASDQTLVFAAAAKLSQQSGLYPSKLLGNAGFAKLDVNLSSRNLLSLRLNTSRYSGENNVFLDPQARSPLTAFPTMESSMWRPKRRLHLLPVGFRGRLMSHLRVQYSRDLQWSETNSTDPLSRIPGILDGMGRSSILPRETREHRTHVAETISHEGKRHAWKFGGDALLTTIYNFFPSNFGGEFIFDPINVDPFTFQPLEGGLTLTPLRAFAHQVPHYYVQSVGIGGQPSGYKRICGLRSGHDSRD